ncbi:Armadillo repeat-containing protein 4, partial [Cladochytrium tenue]
MGATLSARVELASQAHAAAAAENGADTGEATVADSLAKTSIEAHELLRELAELVDTIAARHPAEARAEFRRPLQWTSTSLRPAHFAAATTVDPASSVAATQQTNAGGLWNVGLAGPKVSRPSVSSVATRADGMPLFQLDQMSTVGAAVGTDGPPFVARVSSFEYLAKVLQIANGMKMRELQDILAANPSPVAAIFGVSGKNTGTVLMDAFDALNAETDPKRRDAKGRLYKLLERSLDMIKITRELQMLKSFCGRDQKCALLNIDWESAYTFTNGVKAPPWRQVYDELGYLEVHCPDCDKFLVTASKSGYFVNKGYTTDEKGGEKLNYNRASEAFSTLVDLIKTRSQHFAERIDKQDYLYQPENRGDTRTTAPMIGTVEVARDSLSDQGSDEDRERDLDVPGTARAKDARQSNDTSMDEEVQDKRQENNELPAEYYQIQKLVKYLRIGNQTATIIAICSLRDFDLTSEPNQLAIRDVGGLDTIVNLLNTDDPKCKIGALKILKDISHNVQIRSAISDLDGMQPLVELLKDSDDLIKCLAAETIAHCAKNARNRRAVRRNGGIRKLVRLLKIKPDSKDESVVVSGALALAACSKSARNKEAIQAAGSIPLLASLLESRNEALLIPVVGILQECASEESYRAAIRTSGMIRFLVENLSSSNELLQAHCASAIFKCAEDDETRVLVRKFDGLGPLVNLLDSTGNKELLVAATGAVWKCAQNTENVAALNKINTIKKLIGLLDNQPEDVLVNVVGALGACAQT